MAGMTAAIAQTHLDAWLAANLALATSQSYKVGTRSLTRADGAEVQRQIAYWTNEVQRLKNGRGRGARVIRAIPRDL